MITKFTTYIKESRESVDELEMLNPEELGKLLRAEVMKPYPDLGYIQNLIDVGCPIDIRNAHSSTPLHRAAGAGSIEVVKYLISKGADVNAVDVEGWNALHWAANGKQLDILILLLSLDIDIDIDVETEDGMTALHFAAENGDLETVELLLYKGANVNARNHNNNTPLHYATEGGDLDLVKFLVSNGADVNARNSAAWTPLHSAVISSNILNYIQNCIMVRFMISKGADIHARDIDGEAPWDLANKSVKVDIPELNPNK